MEEAGYRGCPYMMCISDDVWGTNILNMFQFNPGSRESLYYYQNEAYACLTL